MGNHCRYDYTSLELSKDATLRGRLELRSRALREIRECFFERGYLEIDTPVLRLREDPTDNPVFSTLGPSGWPRIHLRTCPEEYTRRAAAILGKAFEIGKNFRNSRIDSSRKVRTHLPEFTIVEFYERGNSVETAIALMWEILCEAVKALEIEQVTFQGHQIEFAGNFVRKSVFKALEETGDSDCIKFVKEHRYASSMDNRDVEAKRLGRLIDKHVRPKLIQPTFLSDFPRSADPYPDPDIDHCLQRAELTIGGIEIGEVALLQCDADVLSKHVRCAIEDRHGLNAINDLVDEPYLEEIRHLKTDVIGGGFGFDRFMMLLTDQPDIREVVWYPGIGEEFVRRRME